MPRQPAARRHAERVLEGLDHRGQGERVVLWIERREGGLWAVGRAVDPQLRQASDPRPDDYICETYELDEALDQANAALEDEVRVLEAEGLDKRVPPFTRKEVLPLLERWFFRGA
jgi:hypothetical protein